MCQCNGIYVNKKAEDNLKTNHQEKKTTKTKPKWTKFSLVKLASNICTGFSSFRTFCHYLSDVRVVFGFRDRAAKMAQWFDYLCPRMWPGASCTPTRCRCSRLHWCRGRRPSLGLISCRTWQRSGLTYVRWWCFILWQHTCVRIWGNQTLPASGSLSCTCLVVELFRLLWGICTSSRSTSHFSRATCRKIGPLLRTLCVCVGPRCQCAGQKTRSRVASIGLKGCPRKVRVPEWVVSNGSSDLVWHLLCCRLMFKKQRYVPQSHCHSHVFGFSQHMTYQTFFSMAKFSDI